MIPSSIATDLTLALVDPFTEISSRNVSCGCELKLIRAERERRKSERVPKKLSLNEPILK